MPENNWPRILIDPAEKKIGHQPYVLLLKGRKSWWISSIVAYTTIIAVTFIVYFLIRK